MIIEGKKYFKLIEHYKKMDGIKKPALTSYCKCMCDCGTEFSFRRDRLKYKIACKSCTITINGCIRKGGKYLTIPNYSDKRRYFESYKRRAKGKGFEFTLTQEQAFKLYDSNCSYCGKDPEPKYLNGNNQSFFGPFKASTIDRIDSNKGYVMGNVVPCCTMCNKAKLDNSLEDFLSWVNRVYNYQNK